jgi:hypothetical protein
VVFGSTVVVAAGVALFALLVPDKHSVVGLDSEAPLSYRLYWVGARIPRRSTLS